MKVLIICPKFTNNIAPLFNLKGSDFGGWIDGLIENLKQEKNININIALFKKSKVSNITTQIKDKINSFYVEYNLKDETISNFFKNNNFDVIHIIGIEHYYIKDLIPYLPYNKTILNITGIQYEYEKVYLAKYNKYNKNKNPLLLLNLKTQQSLVHKQGLIEKEILKKAKYVMGRTNWDKQSVLSINSNLRYFSCNENLRDDFYTDELWNKENIEKHSIFISQGSYSIKGLHIAIEIIRILKEIFPNVKCYIAGENLIKSKSILTLLNSSYASLIKNLIKQYNLKDNLIFTGFLNAKQMKEKMLKSNVFLMPSVIENSVNSLQEAMILGVPCVSSNVGGVPSLIDENSCLTYNFDDIKDAASKISMLFNNEYLSSFIGNNASIRIKKLANRKSNTQTLIKIYKEIIKENK